MVVTSLDKIVKNILLKRRYPLHYYLDFLIYCKDGLREMAFDLPILPLRVRVLQVNQDDNTVDFPDDYQDYTRVSAWVDGYIRPLVETNALQIVPNYDSDFALQPYSDGVAVDSSTDQTQVSLFGWGANNYWWATNWNVFGENLGRQFGGTGAMYDTFRVDRGNKQFKINENLYITQIVLEYISNGMDADSATHINGYAQAAIEQYAMWQFKEHNRTYGAGEAENERQKYIQERQILTARLSDLNLDRLKRIVQSNSIAIKY